MKKHYLSVILIFLLITMPYAVANPQTQQTSRTEPAILTAETIYVDDSNTAGPWNGTHDCPYQYISDGVFHANEGDTVYVFNGLYNETIRINKSIYLRGEQQDNTIIDGQNNGSVLTLQNDNIIIRRFTIRNSAGHHGDAGILQQSNHTTINECTIYRTRTGILAQNHSETTITNSKFYTNGYGIATYSTTYITIDSCAFYHNGIGAYFYDTHCITITNSYTDTNGIGFLCEASTHIMISDSAARDNDDNEGGMFFTDSMYITITNCHLNHNGVGINLVDSSTCYINHCNFSLNTHFACKLKRSTSAITLTNCIFSDNLRYAVYAEDSAFTLSWNNLYQNENYGLYATSCMINAAYNWWGRRMGPAHTGLSLADRGTLAPRTITYAPWLTFPAPEVGPDWVLEKTFTKPQYTNPWLEHITFTEPDTDNDAAPDIWETTWGYDPLIWDDHYTLDPDRDSLNNIEECYMSHYNTSPYHKDVFLEFDWMTPLDPYTTNKPQPSETSQIIDAFAAHNITLHIDTGNLGGGEELPTQAYVSYADIIDIYWDYFLHNDMNNPRQRIFHYGIICDYSEGPGFAVMGWDSLNGFIIGASFLENNFPRDTREWLTAAASMHELGHTFGLIATTYTGIDNQATIKPIYKEFWLYMNYKSLLNYAYTYLIMDYSDGTHGPGDYNDWDNLNFSFFKNTNFSYPAN